MDRMDREITLSCWHPGGTDEHAPLFSGTAEGFVEWLWPVHATMRVTRHVVSNILIDLDLANGRAASETYWSLVLRIPRGGQDYDTIAGGRYLDRFECIGGIWGIRHRTSILDIDRVEPVLKTMADFTDPLIEANNPETVPPRWARDRTDHSYQFLSLIHI